MKKNLKPKNVHPDAHWNEVNQEWVFLAEKNRDSISLFKFWKEREKGIWTYGSFEGYIKENRNVKHGKLQSYFPNGELYYTVNFIDNKKQGKEICYRSYDDEFKHISFINIADTIIKREVYYEKNVCYSEKYFDENGIEFTQLGETIPLRPETVNEYAIYYPNEGIWYSFNYKVLPNGNLHKVGVQKLWNKDGILTYFEKYSYQDFNRNKGWVFETEYECGNILEQIEYYQDSEQIRTHIVYNEDGEKITHIEYYADETVNIDHLQVKVVVKKGKPKSISDSYKSLLEGPLKGWETRFCSDQEILDFEQKIGIKIKNDFKEFLNFVNGFCISEWRYYGLSDLQEQEFDNELNKKFVKREDRWLFTEVSNLYGLGENSMYYDLGKVQGHSFPEEFIKHFYEIGHDYGGNTLIQIINGKHQGKVALIDHEVADIFEDMLTVVDYESEEGEEYSFESFENTTTNQIIAASIETGVLTLFEYTFEEYFLEMIKESEKIYYEIKRSENVIQKNEFLDFFNGFKIPKIIIDLLDFDEKVNHQEFSDGFQLTIDKEKLILKKYSDNKTFLNSILEFAQADKFGSKYAFWLREGEKDLENTPIVIIGNDGGYHIVAMNIREFLRILTSDIEPLVDSKEVIYFKDGIFYEPSICIEQYRKWVYENYQISHLRIKPDDNIEIRIEEKYQEEFNNWFRKYAFKL